MRHREAMVGKLGIKRLDVAQRRIAGGRIAHMPDAAAAVQFAHDVVAVEIAGDMAERPVGVEIFAVEGGDARRFLPAVLERVKAKRDEARRVVGAPNSENSALLAQFVVIERVGRQVHGGLCCRGGESRAI